LIGLAKIDDGDIILNQKIAYLNE